MKNRIIASLVGALIIFLWQFISWTVSGIHDGGAKYNPQQNEILNALSTHIQEDGVYMVPRSAPDASQEEMKQQMENMEGKPYAMVTYVSSYENNMVRSMIRGFLIDLFLVYLVIFILTRAGNPVFVNWILGAVSIGFFTWLWGPYTAHNWFQMPWEAITGHLIDAIAAWALCGIWLGWYMNRKKMA